MTSSRYNGVLTLKVRQFVQITRDNGSLAYQKACITMQFARIINALLVAMVNAVRPSLQRPFSDVSIMLREFEFEVVLMFLSSVHMSLCWCERVCLCVSLWPLSFMGRYFWMILSWGQSIMKTNQIILVLITMNGFLIVNFSDYAPTARKWLQIRNFVKYLGI